MCIITRAGPTCALRNPRSYRAAGQPQPSNLRGVKAPLVMSFVLSCKVATDTQVQFTIKCTFASESIVAARRHAIAGPPRRAQETSTLRNSRAQRRICRAPRRAAAMAEPRAPSVQLRACACVRGHVRTAGCHTEAGLRRFRARPTVLKLHRRSSRGAFKRHTAKRQRSRNRHRAAAVYGRCQVPRPGAADCGWRVRLCLAIRRRLQ